jgi:hypothetical protein
MTHPDRVGGRLICLLIGALLVVVFPAEVYGHAELETSTPDDGSTVPSPFDGPVVLDFSATLADGSKADLLGPDGATIASATVDGPGATMTITLDVALAPGAYEIKWVSVGEDTDLERGRISFTVAPAASTPSPSAAPSTAASPPPSPEPSGTVDTSTEGGDVLIPIIVALMIVGAAAVYLLSRRNRPTSAG